MHPLATFVLFAILPGTLALPPVKRASNAAVKFTYSGTGCPPNSAETHIKLGHNPNIDYNRPTYEIAATLRAFALSPKTHKSLSCKATITVEGRHDEEYTLVGIGYSGPLRVASCDSRSDWQFSALEEDWPRTRYGTHEIEGYYPTIYKDGATSMPVEYWGTREWCEKYTAVMDGEQRYLNGAGINSFYAEPKKCGQAVVVHVELNNTITGDVTFGFEGKRAVGASFNMEVSRRLC